jgi:TonB family protein
MRKFRIAVRTLLPMLIFAGSLVRAVAQGVIFASPHTTSSPAPEYPEAARTAGVSGPVVIQVQIDATGNVTDAKVVSGNAMLTESALKAVRTWKFEPTLISGQAVAVTSTVTVNFASTPVAAPATIAPTTALRMTPGMIAPSIIYREEPQYTPEARQARAQGTVNMEAIVHKDGSVEVVRVVRGVGMGLDESAQNALRQWKFKPATLNGQPVDVVLNIEVNFNLRNGPPAVPAPVPPLGPTPAPTQPAMSDGPDKIIGSLKWEIREEATGQVLAQGDGPVRLKDVSIREGLVTAVQRPSRKSIRLTDQLVIELVEDLRPGVERNFLIASRFNDSSDALGFAVQDPAHAATVGGAGVDIEMKQVDADWEVTKTRFAVDISWRLQRTGVDPVSASPHWGLKIFKGSTITWPSLVNGKVTPN